MPTVKRKPATFTESFNALRAEWKGSHGRADYRAAQVSRFHSGGYDIAPTGASADYHYRSDRDYLRLIERGRQIQREDGLVGQGVGRLVTNVIQGGFNLDPDTGDADLDRALKDEWEAWSLDPDRSDAAGEHDFTQKARFALADAIFVGDSFHLPRRDGTVQSLEAHRARTPSNTTKPVVHGVLLGPNRRHEEYWFTKEELHPSRALRLVGDTTPVKARDENGRRNVLHMYLPGRLSQTRGVTALAPVMDTIDQHADLQFAALVKAQMASMVAILRERPADSPDYQPAPIGSVAQAMETREGYTQAIEGLAAGLDVVGAPGEKISAFGANVPGSQHFEHTLLLLTVIAVNLHLPVHVLLLDPSRTNFSGWRGAIDQARLKFAELQQWIVRGLYDPVYAWFVRRTIETNPIVNGLARKPKLDPYRHAFHAPGWSYIEPLKDAQADDLQQSRLLQSPRRIQSRRGQDWNVVSRECVDDSGYVIRLACAKAAAINDEFPGAGVTWRDCLTIGNAVKPVTQAAPTLIEDLEAVDA
ncbi:phage portal protein [Alienimonas sp. DA493]|uniref:phage portal protein n=1 Tax=Alienimonas sp. DA493 TaxID=3373605 RepID=UPI003753EF7A